MSVQAQLGDLPLHDGISHQASGHVRRSGDSSTPPGALMQVLLVSCRLGTVSTRDIFPQEPHQGERS